MSWYNRAILPVRTVIRDILKNCREETELFPRQFWRMYIKSSGHANKKQFTDFIKTLFVKAVIVNSGCSKLFFMKERIRN